MFSRIDINYRSIARFSLCLYWQVIAELSSDDSSSILQLGYRETEFVDIFARKLHMLRIQSKYGSPFWARSCAFWLVDVLSQSRTVSRHDGLLSLRGQTFLLLWFILFLSSYFVPKKEHQIQTTSPEIPSFLFVGMIYLSFWDAVESVLGERSQPFRIILFNLPVYWQKDDFLFFCKYASNIQN